jgi:biopolymer transport protein ExbD
MRSVALAILVAFVVANTLSAQSPVIVQAATPAATTSQQSANSASLQEALKMLQEMKAANEETLRKQAATLEQLDELEKAAEQIKIYSKRG